MRGAKKPPTKSKGIIKAGTKAMTTEASLNKVESMSPYEEAIQAIPSIEIAAKSQASKVL